MARPPIEHVSSPARWRVLLSPVRAEIAEALRCIGPCSIAELAALVDRPADALYRHIERLEHAGFVAKAGLRKKGRHVEQLIDVVADDFQIAFKDSTGREENRAIVESARTVLRTAERAVAESAAGRQLELRPGERNLRILYELSWLTPENFQRVRALFDEIKAIYDAGRREREGRLYLAVAVAVPVTRRRRANERPRAANVDASTAGRGSSASRASANSRTKKQRDLRTRKVSPPEIAGFAARGGSKSKLRAKAMNTKARSAVTKRPQPKHARRKSSRS